MVFAAVAIAAMMPGQALSSARLEDMVATQIVHGSPWEGQDVEIDEFEAPSYNAAADKPDEVRVKLPSGMKPLGKISFAIGLVRDGREFKRVWASARVHVYRNAVIALNNLKMGSTVSRDDVRLAKVEMNDGYDAIGSVDEAEGMIVARPVTAGSTVRKEYLKPENVVKRGEMVTVTVENDKFRIKSKGVAAEDGHRGSVINVRTAGGRIVTGKVTGPGEMAIEF